jgi:hypothetical protein
LSCLVLSCENDLTIDSKDAFSYSKDATIIDGRFHFNSEESLKNEIDSYSKQDLTTLENKFASIYEKGFRSSRFVINSKNEALLSKISNETTISSKPIANATSGNNGLQLATEKPQVIVENEKNDFIKDPVFAAFLNKNNEIVVKNKLYKIIKDIGVLSVNIKDTTHLYNYLKSPKAKALTIDAATLRNCPIMQKLSGQMAVDSKITRFIAPPVDNCSGGSGGGVVTPPVITLEDRIKNLPISTGTNEGSVFGGTVITSKSYFDSRRRIVTEFWNQDYLIYSSAGVQVRTQVKTLGIFWASDAEEIYMGINKIVAKIKFAEPKINSFNPNPSSTAPNVYMYNSNYSFESTSDGIKFVNMYEAPKLPFFRFGEENILNIYIHQLPNPNVKLNTESNIKNLYWAGIQFLQRQVGNTNPSRAMVFSYQVNPTEIEVVYVGSNYQGANTNKLKKSFDRQWKDISLTIKSDSNGIIDFSKFSTYNIKVEKGDFFRTYSDLSLDFYGLARKGSTWKGNRIVR